MAIVVTLFLFLASQLIAGLMIGFGAAAAHLNVSEWFMTTQAQFIYGLLADTLIITGIYACLRWFRWSWQTIGLRRPIWWQILLGVGAAVPYYLLYGIIVIGVKAVVPSLNVDQPQDIGFHGVTGAVPLILTFISLVILPPLAEEITMRGFLYTGLRQRLPVVLAALVVSLLFGTAHLAEGGDAGPLWIGAIDTFVLSLVLCFLREKTGNLWSGIVLHATKNGIAFLLLFVIHAA